MKADSIFILCILVCLLGFSIGVTLNTNEIDLDMSDILTPAITLLSVFLGARLAYTDQRKQRVLDQSENQAKLGNQALLVLYKQNMVLRGFSEFINEFKSHRNAYILLGPKLAFDEPDMSVNSNSLLFLSDKNDFELLTKIISTDQIFRHSAEYLNARSELFNEGFLPAIMKSDHQNIPSLTEKEVIDLIGFVGMAKLREMTRLLYMSVEEALNDNFTVSKELLTVLCSRFPKHDYDQYIRMFENAKRISDADNKLQKSNDATPNDGLNSTAAARTER